VDRERYEVLHQLEDALEVPLLILGFAWLVLLVVELVRGLSPFLQTLVTVIWIVFIIEFVIRLLLAPKKLDYFRANWLTALSLLVPAFRVLRVVRALRVLRLASTARGVRLFQILSSLNRGMRTLRAVMGRRGFGYVLALTVVVTLVGAAGMQAFESTGSRRAAFDSYGEALWWTVMLMTTIGTEFSPVTGEGRILALLLALYGLAVFGYLTATLATYFIGLEAEHEEAEIVGERSIRALRAEIAALHAELERLSPRQEQGGEGEEG
jgi:voltage-gated potassium channel